ncbi:MAG TPA: hypothetical protein VFS16_00580, partial [Acidimicrobiia bacterium]|nr:hypothetical protein [Acidimicrobiia bacterium]
TQPGGGGTQTTLPGGTTSTTILPNPDVNWGPAGTTSVIAKGTVGGGSAFRPWMSADGRYLVFDSDAKKVMGGAGDPAPGIRDVYLYDRTTGGLERISVGPGGRRANVPGNGSGCANPCGSQRPTISADGRYVAFWSSADNLVDGDTNGEPDAFLRDRQTGTTTLISKGFQGAQANGESRRPVVSRDGTFVAFESAASNLIAPASCGLLTPCTGGDKNNADDVYLYEVGTGAITLMSADAKGSAGNGASNRPSLSGNGRKVVFQSEASNLVANDANGATSDVIMRDVAAGQTTIVSTNSAGAQSDKSSTSPSISADGRWVSFDSRATTFNPADSGGDVDVYVKDLETGAIEQVSVRSGGGQASAPAGGIVGGDSTVSADGRFVAFWSDAPNLVDGDTNGDLCDADKRPCSDVFVRDRATNTTTRMTSTNGVEGNEESYSPALSMDGKFVAFDSKATSLDPSGGSTSSQDIFVHVNF